MRERDVENHLAHRVRDAGGLCWKWVSPGIRGVPDRIAMLYGKTYFIEVKAPGEKPSHQQERVHAKLRAQGMVVVVINSNDAADFFVNHLIEEHAHATP